MPASQTFFWRKRKHHKKVTGEGFCRKGTAEFSRGNGRSGSTAHEECTCALRSLEHVADARSRDNILRVAGILPDLLPEAGHGYLQYVGIAAVFLSPYLR